MPTIQIITVLFSSQIDRVKDLAYLVIRTPHKLFMAMEHIKTSTAVKIRGLSMTYRQYMLTSSSTDSPESKITHASCFK